MAIIKKGLQIKRSLQTFLLMLSVSVFVKAHLLTFKDTEWQGKELGFSKYSNLFEN